MSAREDYQFESVQAGITSASFPETMDDFRKMVFKNRGYGPDFTDMDALLTMEQDEEISWTAAKWMVVGDILFFYHTKNAQLRTRTLYGESLRTFGPENAYTVILQRAMTTAQKYGGALFACGQVTGESFYSRSEEHQFANTIFATVSRVHVFPHPLPLVKFSSAVQIGQTTITPLYGYQCEEVRTMLAEDNPLPDFLVSAHFGMRTFRNINRDNWAEIACAVDKRFVDEDQVRVFLLDYLLADVKDPGSPLLEECETFRNGEATGRADYIIKVHGHWIPVEAKLTARSEHHLDTQLEKYTRIQSFVPTKGSHRGAHYDASNHGLILVADQFGLYAVRDGQFVGCDVFNPLWLREDLSKARATEIRDWLRTQM